MRGIARQMLAVPGRDGHAALVDQREVPFGDAEHVEVVAKPRAGVEPAQDRRDPLRHPGRAQRLVRHRPAVDPLEREDVPSPRRPRTTRGETPVVAAATRVVPLVRPVYGEQLGRRARDADEVGDAIDRDPVVRVGQAGRDRLVADRPARPGGDRRDDVARSWVSLPPRALLLPTLAQRMAGRGPARRVGRARRVSRALG